MSSLAKNLSGKSQQVKMYAKGGMVHSDEKQDKVLIKKMINAAEKREDMKCGGKVKGKK